MRCLRKIGTMKRNIPDEQKTLSSIGNAETEKGDTSDAKPSADRPLSIKPQSFLRSFMTTSGWNAISRLSGLLREQLIFALFGAGIYTDIYTTVLRFPSFFRRFFAEGALSAILIPHFSGLVAQNEEKHLRTFACQMASVLALGLIAFIALFEFAMPTVVRLTVSGLKDDPFVFPRLVYYARWMFPYLWFISMVAFMSGILNSLHRFAWAAAISIVANVCTIVILCIGWLFEKSLTKDALLFMISAGILVGGTVQCLIMWTNCRKNGVTVRLVQPRLTPEIKGLLKLAVPGMIGASVTQINVLVDVWFASHLPTGSLSYLSCADRLHQLPLSLFGAALGIALLPSLSAFWQANDVDRALQTQSKAVAFSLLCTLPAAIGLFVLAEPIVAIVYGHGRFDAFAVHQTMMALKAFVFALPFYVMSKVFSSVFFAKKDLNTPVFIAAVCVLVNVVLNSLLQKPFAHVGIAMATATSGFVNAILGGMILKKRGWFTLDRQQRHNILKVILSSAAMGALVFVSHNIFTEAFGVGFLGTLATLLVIIVGVVSYGLMVYGLKVKL